MKWRTKDFGEYVEVTPIGDTKQHNAGDECWCSPKVIREKNNRPVISHQADNGESFTQRQIPGDVDTLIRGAIVSDLIANLDGVENADEGVELIENAITDIKKTMSSVLIEYMEASLNAMPNNEEAGVVLRRKWAEFQSLLFAERVRK